MRKCVCRVIGLLDSQSRTRLQDCARQTEKKKKKKKVNGEAASVWMRAKGGKEFGHVEGRSESI